MQVCFSLVANDIFTCTCMFAFSLVAKDIFTCLCMFAFSLVANDIFTCTCMFAFPLVPHEIFTCACMYGFSLNANDIFTGNFDFIKWCTPFQKFNFCIDNLDDCVIFHEIMHFHPRLILQFEISNEHFSPLGYHTECWSHIVTEVCDN